MLAIVTNCMYSIVLGHVSVVIDVSPLWRTARSQHSSPYWAKIKAPARPPLRSCLADSSSVSNFNLFSECTSGAWSAQDNLLWDFFFFAYNRLFILSNSNVVWFLKPLMKLVQWVWPFDATAGSVNTRSTHSSMKSINTQPHSTPPSWSFPTTRTTFIRLIELCESIASIHAIIIRQVFNVERVCWSISRVVDRSPWIPGAWMAFWVVALTYTFKCLLNNWCVPDIWIIIIIMILLLLLICLYLVYFRGTWREAALALDWVMFVTVAHWVHNHLIC